MKNNFKHYKKTFNLVFLNIKNTFPFLTKNDFLNFEKKYFKEKTKLEKIKNDQDFFIFLEKFLASLKNSHTKLINYPNKKLFKPKGYQVIMCENKFLLKKGNNIIGEILAIDGKKPSLILNKYKKRISASTPQYKINQALKFLLVSNQKDKINLKILDKNKKYKNICLQRSEINFTPWKKTIEKKIINKNIGYLKVKTWIYDEVNKQTVDAAIKYFKKNKIKKLIIDVRGNGGGNSNMAKYLASYFFNKKVCFNITKERKNKKTFDLIQQKNYVEPNKEVFLSIPVILLVDSYCLSSNEYFIAGMKDNKRAIVIGERTGGGSGNPKFIHIPFKDDKLKISISTWQYFRINNKILEGKGVKPDIFVKNTCENLIKNEDKILKKAKSFKFQKSIQGANFR